MWRLSELRRGAAVERRQLARSSGAMNEPSNNPALTIDGVLETALYVDDLARARAFYAGALGLQPLYEDQRMCAFAAGSRSVLLLFPRGGSLQTVVMPGGTIPPHDGHGPLHVAFAVPAEQLSGWEARLQAQGIAVEGRTNWRRGGRSIYFRDPDGHLLELATPGLWAIY
jgi:catechol 2,3-dioxygenase-like lactoylglutathione lyase family enzyme